MLKIFRKVAFFVRGIFHLNYIEQLLEESRQILKESIYLLNRLKGVYDEDLKFLVDHMKVYDDRLKALVDVRKDVTSFRSDIEELLKVVEVRFALLNEKLNSYFRLIDDKYGIFPRREITLTTEHPLAEYSDDYKFPRGAKNDNTHCLRFVRKCEDIFGRKVSYLDLGCAGGGLVLDFLSRGNFAVGLEGSDYPSKNVTGEWSLIDRYLFNCDITKEFKIMDTKTGRIYKFDVIGLWEVFEHIPEEFLPQLMTNIKNHLKKDGLLAASIAVFRDEDKELGAVYHVNVKDKEWWKEFFENSGFELVDGLFEIEDFPRGSGNRSRVRDWSAIENPELGFHIVAKLKKE